MPTELGRPYALGWRGDPPHMLKPDIPVWYRFLALYGEPIKYLYYDCLLGGPEYLKDQVPDYLQRTWNYLRSKRADAIAELENEVWLIEVSSDPGFRSLGQLQAYRLLWIRDPKIAKPERLLLVCETIDPDILDAAGAYGLEIYVV